MSVGQFRKLGLDGPHVKQTRRVIVAAMDFQNRAQEGPHIEQTWGQTLALDGFLIKRT